MKTILFFFLCLACAGVLQTRAQQAVTGVLYSEPPAPEQALSLGIAVKPATDQPALSGPYFGMPAPGSNPVRFAASRIPLGAWGITFTPDGKECFLTRTINGLQTLQTSKEMNGDWTVLEIPTFSGTYFDMESAITPDGQRMYFGSMRPEGSLPSGILYQWYVEKTDSGWSDPRPMDPPLYGVSMMFPSIASNNNMYYTASDGVNPPWISVSRFSGGQYQQPERLSDSINAMPSPAHPFIALDESYILFDAVTDTVNWARDLYICYRKPDGSWTKALSLGAKFNNTVYSMFPFVSRDGKYFFFTRDNVMMWADAGFIEQMRPRYGNYFGQAPPDTVPERFAKDFLGIPPNQVYSITFSPDLKECFFSNLSGSANRIWCSAMTNDLWSKPAKAGFPQSYWTIEPNFSPDGNKLFFVSDMPDIPPGPPFNTSLRIWGMDRIEGGWSDPQVLPGPFSTKMKMFPSVAANGNLYYTEVLDSVHAVIMKSEFLNGQYMEPIILDSAVNRYQMQAHPFIAPDESWLLFDASPGGPPLWRNFLYISYRNTDGSWQPARKLDTLINSGSQYCSSVSPDGKYLFFSRNNEAGSSDLWWVKAENILHPAGITGPDGKNAANGLLKVYPNPASGITTFFYALENHSVVRLIMINSLGQVCRMLPQAYQAPGSHSISVQTQGLAPGIYTCRLMGVSGCNSVKLIVLNE